MYSETLKKALEFMEFEKLPSMKTLQERFRKFALKMHPDKFPEEEKEKKTEEFKNLVNALKVIGDAVKEENLKEKAEEDNPKEDTNENESDDREFEDEYDWFNQWNFDRRNQKSHTILIEKRAVPAWKAELERKCGSPEEKKEQKAFIFRLNNYEIDGEFCTITIHLYPSTAKLLIQSSKQFFNDVFCLKDLIKMYREVHKNIKMTIGAQSKVDSPKNRTTRSKSKKTNFTAAQKAFRSCKECSEMFMTVGEKRKHEMEEHSKDNEKGEKTGHDKKNADSSGQTEEEVVTSAPSLFASTKVEAERKKANAKITDLKIDVQEKALHLEKLKQELNAVKKELRKVKTENVKLETDKKTIKAELQKSFDLQSKSAEENTRLKKENSLLQECLDEKTERGKENNSEKVLRTPNQSKPSQKKICNVCKQTFDTEEEVKGHHLTNHIEKCDKCGKVCKSGEQLRNHIKNEHRERILQCDLSDKCNYTASSERQLVKHKEIDHVKQICRFWIQNSCRFRSNCWYSHQLPSQSWDPAGREERDTPRIDSHAGHDDPRDRDIRSEQRQSRNQVLCRFNENCRRPNCWFFHDGDFLAKHQSHPRPGRMGRHWGI